MRKNKRKGEGDGGAPAWVVTYGDMMSLLLTFFIFLFSFSTIDQQEFTEIMEALKAQLGILTGGRTFNDGAALDRGMDGIDFSPVEEESEFQELIEQVQTYVRDANLEADVTLAEDERGLTIRTTGQVLYDLGKANLKPEGVAVLTTISKFLEAIPNDIMVEGHTDDLPIKNAEFEDNFDLSSKRATNVIRFFRDNTRIDTKRLAAAGYGEFKPLVANTNEASRAKNRRVDIVILKKNVDDETTGEGNHG